MQRFFNEKLDDQLENDEKICDKLEINSSCNDSNYFLNSRFLDIESNINSSSYSTENNKTETQVPLCDIDNPNHSYHNRHLNERKLFFFILTERKMKPDAILKKVNISFYSWVYKYLNKISPTGLSFIKFSENIIKTVKKQKVKKTMNLSLQCILENDPGNRKYNNRDINKCNLIWLKKNRSEETKCLEEFLQLPLKSIYQMFIECDKRNKFPGLFNSLYNYFKDNYLSIHGVFV